MQCSTVRYSAVWYRTMQCSTVQCGTEQCSAVQCSAVHTVLYSELLLVNEHHSMQCYVMLQQCLHNDNSTLALLLYVLDTSILCCTYGIRCTQYTVLTHSTTHTHACRYIAIQNSCLWAVYSAPSLDFLPHNIFSLPFLSQEFLCYYANTRGHSTGWFSARGELVAVSLVTSTTAFHNICLIRILILPLSMLILLVFCQNYLFYPVLFL